MARAIDQPLGCIDGIAGCFTPVIICPSGLASGLPHTTPTGFVAALNYRVETRQVEAAALLVGVWALVATPLK